MRYSLSPLFYLALSLLLNGCGDPSVPIDWNTHRSLQQPEQFEQDRLLFEQDGWRVWRLEDRFKSRCVGLKPALNLTWPTFHQDFTVLSGGAGFFMVIEDVWQRPNFSFYGDNPFGRIAFAYLDEDTILDIDNQEIVLAWEGRTVEFKITSQPGPDLYLEAVTQQNSVDFSGVNNAFAALLACHENRLRAGG